MYVPGVCMYICIYVCGSISESNLASMQDPPATATPPRMRIRAAYVHTGGTIGSKVTVSRLVDSPIQ